MDKFKLSHVVLYSKGWYCKTDDIWEDLKHILKLDGYTPFNKSDVFNIIVRQYQEHLFNGRLTDFLIDISPNQIWKSNYFTKNYSFAKSEDNLPEYDYMTAVMYKIMSDLRFLDKINEKCDIVCPKYSKEYPRPNNISLQKVIEMFNK